MRRDEFIKKTAVLALVGASGASFAACIGSSTDEAARVEHYFRYAENQAETYPTTQAAYYFADLVETRSDGRIKIVVYPAAALGDEMTAIEQVQLGMIDFARVSLGALSVTIPFLNVLQLPFLYENASHMWRVLDGEIGDACMASLSDANLLALSWYDAGARSFYSIEHPIETLEDMAGLQIRVQESSLISDMMLALGATPIQLVFDEVYANLQGHEIDGAENNYPSYESMKHYEVAPYFSEIEHIRIPELQLMSKTTMSKLSDADLTLVLEAAKESALYERSLWSARETSSKETVALRGAQIYTFPEAERQRFVDAVTPLYETYCGDDLDLIAAIKEQS